MNGVGIRVVALVCVLFPATPGARGQEFDFDAMMSDSAGWIQENLPVDWLEEVEIPPPEEWGRFWDMLGEELESSSLEAMAEFMPYAEAASRLLARVRGGEDYAAWLRQKLDFLEMAGEAVRLVPEPPAPKDPVPSPPPPGRPSVVAGRTVHLVPVRKPAARSVPAVVAVRRQAVAESERAWKRKLSKRPAPVAAKDLVPRLKAVFRREGVPEELVWIAEVESTMNPNARNPGGAVGLFQFMPATARRFGLRTYLPDERKHPEKSAQAAARYLKFLYGEFGSWPLAVAAYNAGEGRVRQCLDKARGGSTGFAAIRPHLPLETRMYVPKVEAVISLREGVDRLNLPAPRA